MPRLGGNPDIWKYGFKTDRKESLTAKMTLRLAPSMMEAIKEKDNWQEWVRKVLEENLEKEKLKD